MAKVLSAEQQLVGSIPTLSSIQILIAVLSLKDKMRIDDTAVVQRPYETHKLVTSGATPGTAITITPNKKKSKW